jgi:antitoxin ParD1/3/4
MAKKFAIRPDLEEFAARLVASGRYEQAEDAISDGLELLKDQEFAREARRAEMYAKIEEGIAFADRDELIPAEQVFAEIRALIDQNADDSQDAA